MKFAKIDLKNSHHKKKRETYEVIDILISYIVVIIS